MSQHVLEGTWKEIQEQIRSLRLSDNDHVRLVLDQEFTQTPSEVRFLQFGMFPQLQALTDDDFKAAEFHGDPDDGLDWS